MPSLTRKRGGPPDTNFATSIKRVRGANRDNDESGLDNSELDIKSEQTFLQKTNIKPARTKRSKVASLSNETDQSGGKDTATQEIKQEAEIHDKATKTRAKRSEDGVKAQKFSAKIEEEEQEEDVKVQSTPKKARKRKAANHEKEADKVPTEPTPKKAKGKRKTKAEKEAEAMPLAARSTGLRMFIGAHVSGAKGGLQTC